jgi:hypothetical protein
MTLHLFCGAVLRSIMPITYLGGDAYIEIFRRRKHALTLVSPAPADLSATSLQATPEQPMQINRSCEDVNNGDQRTNAISADPVRVPVWVILRNVAEQQESRPARL